MKTQQLYEALEKRAQAGPRNKGTRETLRLNSFFRKLCQISQNPCNFRNFTVFVRQKHIIMLRHAVCLTATYAEKDMPTEEGISFRNTYVTASELVF